MGKRGVTEGRKREKREMGLREGGGGGQKISAFLFVLYGASRQSQINQRNKFFVRVNWPKKHGGAARNWKKEFKKDNV